MMQKENVLEETVFYVSHREQEPLCFRSTYNTKREKKINVRTDQNQRE